MSLFGTAQKYGGGGGGRGSKKALLPKICQTYPKMMTQSTVIP